MRAPRTCRTWTSDSSKWRARSPRDRRFCSSMSRPPASARTRRSSRAFAPHCRGGHCRRAGRARHGSRHAGISGKVVVLDAGLRIAAGTPAEVQRDPAVRKAYLGEEQARRVRERRAAVLRCSMSAVAAGYGAEPVLRGIDLNVRQGEMVAVLGANGAGKSTLMRAIAGVHRPVEGGIALEGREISREPAHRVGERGAVLVPEGRQVFPGALRARQPRARRLFAPRVERRRDRVDARAFSAPARACLHQRAGLLSGGEQQMLAIARGLMAKPRLLLLDEPSLGLAPQVVNDLFAVLDRLRAEAATILAGGPDGRSRALARRPRVRARAGKARRVEDLRAPTWAWPPTRGASSRGIRQARPFRAVAGSAWWPCTSGAAAAPGWANRHTLPPR